MTALGATRLNLIGSGQGSGSRRDYRKEVEKLASEVTKAAFEMTTRTVSLENVEAACADTTSSERIVITP